MTEFDRVIPEKRSIIVAADVAVGLKGLVQATIDVPGISGYKLGFSQGLKGLGTAVEIIREEGKRTDKRPVIIYDHKAGNDIPDMGKVFASTAARAGVDTVILFPFAGPAAQEVWTKMCFDAGLEVLTGGVMTHPKFLRSEGGYIADEAVMEIYALAVKLGVRHFVVPGTKIYWVKKIRALLDELLGAGNYVFYAPGFIDQGGIISECGQAAGDEWHAIVGSAIYKKEDMRAAAIAVTKQIII